MRYALTDLPNKPRGVPRVNDRCVARDSSPPARRERSDCMKCNPGEGDSPRIRLSP